MLAYHFTTGWGLVRFNLPQSHEELDIIVYELPDY